MGTVWALYGHCMGTVWALRQGLSHVFLRAGRIGGEGKSMFLKPLHTVFDGPGHVFGTPEAANFPLLDLPGAKVVFLYAFRFDPRCISGSTLDLWFDGSAVPIGRPQNVPGASGNCVYMGTGADLRDVQIGGL